MDFLPFSVAFPVDAVNQFITQDGIRLGWMKAHTCPCAAQTEAAGTPDPTCQACFGRGVYWDKPPVAFTGLVTYMHTSSAPDEPGGGTSKTVGQTQRAEPTLTIPSSAAAVWQSASVFDAYVEYDATARTNTALVVGQDNVIPYPAEFEVTGVTAFNPNTKQVSAVPSQNYTVGAGTVDIRGFPVGTAYTVEYNCSPIFVAYRMAGGMPHRRPFGLGAQVPLRFHITQLDLYTRQRFTGDGPGAGA